MGESAFYPKRVFFGEPVAAQMALVTFSALVLVGVCTAFNLATTISVIWPATVAQNPKAYVKIPCFLDALLTNRHNQYVTLETGLLDRSSGHSNNIDCHRSRGSI